MRVEGYIAIDRTRDVCRGVRGADNQIEKIGLEFERVGSITYHVVMDDDQGGGRWNHIAIAHEP